MRRTPGRSSRSRRATALAVAAAAVVAVVAQPGVGHAWEPGNTAPEKVLQGVTTLLSFPTSVAFDSTGRMYVANDFTDSIRAYADGWTSNRLQAPIRVLSGAATGLNNPMAVAFDSQGRMYVANVGIRVPSITVYASAWESGNTAPIKTLAGDRTGLSFPTGIAFDSLGRMYVANRTGSSITVYAANWAGGNTSPTKILSGSATALDRPEDVAFDADGVMYVANPGSPSVTAYAASWASGDTAPIKTLAGSVTGLSSPSALAFDSNGRMYVVNRGSESVALFRAGWASGNTPPLKTLSGPSTQLDDPVDVALDRDDRMYVVNAEGNSVTAYARDTSPSFTSVSISGTSRVGHEVIATVIGLAGAPDPVLSFRWQSSSDGETWRAIRGATSMALMIDLSLSGRKVRVLATASNGIAPDASRASATVSVPAVPPPSAPGSLDSDVSGRRITLTWSKATAPDVAPVTGYRATCSTSSASVTESVGASARRAVLTAPSTGRYSCRVVARSEVGAGPAAGPVIARVS